MQFEMAPIFEDVNLGNDHNVLAMDVARKVALRHDFVCAVPREAVRRHQRQRQALQLEHVDGPRREPARPGQDAAPEPALPRVRGRLPEGGARPLGRAALLGLRREQRPAPGRERGAAGDPVGVRRRPADEHHRPHDRGGGGEGSRALRARNGRRQAAGARQGQHRPQPHLAVRVHREQVRVPRGGLARRTARCPWRR